MRRKVRVRQGTRKSLAMKVTPRGVDVLVPEDLSPDSPEVQAFINEGLRELPLPEPVSPAERLSRDQLLSLVGEWAKRLGVTVKRVQLRQMSNKWGSISTAGTLTLASDLTLLPKRLVDYVICHELLHLIVSSHTRDYHLLLSQYIHDWQERERELAGWGLALGETER